MSIATARIAFQAAGGPALRLSGLELRYLGNRQVLAVSGWHADGTPFARATPPFDGSPLAAAADLAKRIVAAHGRQQENSRSNPTMSQKGSGLARLMGGLKALDEGADALAGRLETALGNLNAEMATTTQIVGNVEQSVEDLRAVNRLYSNGPAAAGNSSGSSGQSQG